MAHSAREMPVTGTKGTTSAAPMRGWTPVWRVRSISWAALPTARTAASTTAAGEPAMVTTERLWAVSSDQSSRRTPSTCMAATIRRTLAGSVPSEKLGTHSMMASEFIAGLLPPGIAEGELDAGVDAGVLVAKASTGEVDCVGAEVDGAFRADEEVYAYADLGGEVPDAGLGVGAVVAKVEDGGADGGVLVVGPDDSAGPLQPGGDAMGAGEVPAEDDGRDRGTGVSSAYRVEG